MKIITVTNRKGGVGKTTTSTHLAAGLALLGLRVGLVDTDSQGHAGLMLNIPPANGLYDALIQKKDIAECAVYVPKAHYSTDDNLAPGDLWLLPSSDQTYLIAHQLREEEGFAFFETMEAFTAAFALDIIIVDTNPSMSKLDGAIWLATDAFLYVTELNRLSIDGVEKALEQLQRFAATRQRYLNRATHILGIIPNKARKLPRLHRRNKKAMEDNFGDYLWEPIPDSIIWQESTNDYDHPETLFTYAPTSREVDLAMRMAVRTWKAVQVWA